MIVRAATNLALSALKSPPTGYLSQLRNFDLVHGATIAVAEHSGLPQLCKATDPISVPWAPASRSHQYHGIRSDWAAASRTF